MQEHEDIIAGRNPVLEALRAGRTVNKIYLQQGGAERTNQDIYSLAKTSGIPVQWVAKQQLDEKAVTKAHQGVLAFVSPFAYVDLEDILARAQQRNEDPFILLLDHLEDLHNFGAILRTAEAVGVHGVIIPKRRGVSVNSTVAKTSAGAVEYVPVARVPNLVQAIGKLQSRGCWVVGTDAGAQDIFFAADLRGPVAVVIGSEGKGLSRLVRKACDFTLKIPMAGRLNSLNASVASAIILYEIFKQRNSK